MKAKPGYPDDKRKHSRVNDIFIVTYRLHSPIDVSVRTEGREYAGVAMDISEGGMGVDVDLKIPAGTQLRLQFTIVNEFSASEWDRQRTFELDAQACYCEPTNKNSHRVGVLFKNASAEDRKFISEYVRIQALKKYKD